ncbi:MAG: urease subunit gamma [Streptosporangiales bacterium]
MRLTPAEEDRLTVFTLAELARRRHARGALLSAPEVTALVTDVVLEAAWDGLPLQDVVEAGRNAVRADEAVPGAAGLVRHIEVDALFPTGTALVAVDDPLRTQPAGTDPGAVTSPTLDSVELAPDRPRLDLPVTNTAAAPVHVTSHYPFWQTNAALSFDRTAATGYRLDIPSGSSLGFPPGETVTVRLVALAGNATAPELQLDRGEVD